MKEIYSVFKNLQMAKTLMFSLLLLLVCCPGLMMAQTQPVAVTGVVYDPNGAALEGAFVMIERTTRGAVTDRNGNFRIEARQGETLLISYLGMLNQRLTYNGQTSIEIKMQSDFAAVDEVVVIGYGQARRGSITGAVSQVKGEDLLTAPATNIANLLTGRVAGLSTLQSSGQPGADQASLKIRGATGNPLVIVDGVPGSLTYLDPNEIESISVLKDAASTAVFGLGGQAGVIIVKTKQGQKGRPKLDYRGTFGISMNTNYPEFLDGPGYAYWYNKALEMDGATPIFTSDHVAMMLNGDDSDGWGNTNWFDAIFGIGFNQTHNVNMTGGSEKTTYHASMGYFQQKGNIDGFNFDRYNARINLNTKISNRLTYTLGFSGQIGDRRSPGYAAGGTSSSDVSSAPWLSVAEQAAFAHPYVPMYYVAPENATAQQLSYNGLPTATNNSYPNPVNPLAAATLSGKNQSVSYNMDVNSSLQWDIPGVEGLSAKVYGAYNTVLGTARSLKTPYYLMVAAAPGITTQDITYGRQVDARGDNVIGITESFSRSQALNSQISLEYKNTFDKHRVEGLVLLETRDSWGNSLYASGEGMLFPEIAQLDQSDGVHNKVGGSYGMHNKQVGFVWRGIYEYDERYVLEASGRYDGSSKFIGNIPGKRWGYFPAFSFAWRVSNESFIRDNAKFIDNLKFRVSWGELGSDDIGNLAFLSTLAARSAPSVNMGGSTYSTWYTARVANPLLTWSREQQFNVGIDASLWRGMLLFEFDYFHKYKYDMLASTSGNAYSPSMGNYFPSNMNFNKTGTNGVDMKFTHNNRIGEFTYGVTAIVSYAYTKWLRYSGDTPETPAHRRYAGHQVGMYYGFQALGLFQSEEEIDNSPYIRGRRPLPGDIKYKDINGDGEITHGVDNGFFGRSIFPTWTGSLGLNAAWKGFDLSLMFNFGAGHDVRLTGLYYNYNEDSSVFTKPFKAGSNSPRYLVEGAWRPDNTNAQFPRLSINSPNTNNSYASTFWYRDGKYLRMRNFQLGYTIPQKSLAKLGIEKIRVFVEGSNVFTWSGLPTGFDPEFPSVSGGYYPQQRVFMGGLSITF